MKTLKTILVLVFAALTSCTQPEEINLDPVKGAWEYYTVDGKLMPIEGCETRSEIFFKYDGTYTINIFKTDPSGNGYTCALDYSEDGRWTNEGNGRYLLNGGSISVQIEDNGLLAFNHNGKEVELKKR